MRHRLLALVPQACATKLIRVCISLPKLYAQTAGTHLNSTRPSFMPRIAGTTSVTIVPSFAFGMSPRGPNTCRLALGSLSCAWAASAQHSHGLRARNFKLNDGVPSMSSAATTIA